MLSTRDKKIKDEENKPTEKVETEITVLEKYVS